MTQQHRFSHHIKEAFHALYQLRNEFPELKGSRKILYYPDFNLIHPYIYRQEAKRYRFIDSYGRCLFTLYRFVNLPSNISICLSLPGVMEFLVSLHRHHHFFDKHGKDSQFARYAYECMIGLSQGKLNIADVKSEPIKKFLISDGGLPHLDTRINDFVTSISTGKLELMTDYYSPKIINGLLLQRKDIVAEIRHRMESDRKSKDGREDDMKTVSYKADTQNTFLPSLNDVVTDKSVHFVCSDRFFRWAPTEMLRLHQRSPLFLITLLGMLHSLPNNMDLSEKYTNMEETVDRAIDNSRELIEYMESGKYSQLQERNVESFVYTNVFAYLNMAKEDGKQNIGGLSELLDRDLSYRGYLDMIDRKKSSTLGHIRTVHDLVDDATDDMYRDFVSEERVKLALATLKM
jgi:hypothetical protein